MKWQGRRKSGNLEDRRGMSKGKMAAGGGIVVTLIVLGLQFFGGETGKTDSAHSGTTRQQPSYPTSFPTRTHSPRKGNGRLYGNCTRRYRRHMESNF